jgi:hypothetical protein
MPRIFTRALSRYAPVAYVCPMTHLCAVGFRVRILARQPRGASPLVIVKAPPAAREARPSTNGPSPKTGFTDIPPRERARARTHVA